MKRSLTLAALAPLLLGVVGCAGDPLAPFGRLTSLRVLAIQSDPVSPGPGETTTLTPLLYVPQDQAAPELEWSWCPFPGPAGDGYPCLVEEEDFADLGAAGVDLQLPPLELGTGATATFTNGLPPEVLAMLCAGPNGEAAGFACPTGFPVQIRLRAHNDDDEVVAVRSLYLRFDDTQPPNTPPELPGVEMKVERDWVPVDDAFDAPVQRDKANEFRALITEDQAESYPVSDPTGTTTTERERLTLTWFVETGWTKSGHTGFIEGVAPIEVLNENDWFPEREEDYERDTAEMVLVLRDNREGVSWWRHTFDVAEEP
jgi:hypothetical protein